MKLKRLKLNQPYRSLEQGFEINFEPNLSSEKLDPICFVGPNGSGKSNVLEALADIFYYLDSFLLGYTSDDNYVIPIKDFEIEYYLPSSIPGVYTPSHMWENDFCLVKIKKRAGFLPVIDSLDGETSIPVPNKYLLPKKIWAYSSGENEILSLPFLRMDLNYFDQLEANREKEETLIIESNRLHYIDYDTCASILLSNFIMLSNEEEKHKLEIFKERFGINKLSSFKFTIRQNYWMKKELKLPYEIDRFIDSLKTNLPDSCLRVSDNGDMMFAINLEESDQVEPFQSIASGASGLYKYFESLTLLNTHTIAKHRRDKIKNGDDPFYAYSNLYRPPNEKMPFIVEELMINMEGIEEPIAYKTISDGEHQALTILGLFNMIDEEGVLCLLDEPETHLNPKWKYGFIDTLNEIQKNYKSQVITTTHDPIFISGLRKEDVILFNSKTNTAEGQNRWSFPDKDLIGQGVDNLLTSPIFGLNSAIDFPTHEKMVERRILLSKQLRGIEFEEGEQEKLERLTTELSEIDGLNPIDDPIYRDFIEELSKEDTSVYYEKYANAASEEKRKQTASLIIEKLKEQGKL